MWQNGGKRGEEEPDLQVTLSENVGTSQLIIILPPYQSSSFGVQGMPGGMGPWLTKRQAGETPSQLAEEGGDGGGGSWESWPDVASGFDLETFPDTSRFGFW